MESALESLAQSLDSREQRKLVLLEQQLGSESHGRTDMTKDLPVLKTLTLYPDVYTANPDDFEIIGMDEKRVIVPVRTKYMVRIYRRPVLVRKSDDLRCPIQSELPGPIIWKSYSSPELLAQIEVDKYKNHLPFYRQLQMSGDYGTPFRVDGGGFHVRCLCGL